MYYIFMIGKFLRNLNLFFVLGRAQVRSSDYRSVMGALWSIMAPILTFVVLYFIFVERFGQHISQFPSKLLVGVLLITSFHRIVSAIATSLNYSQNIIHDSLTPSETIFLSGLVVPVIKFTVEMGLCILVTSVFINHHAPRFSLLLPMAFLYFLLAAGFGFFLATLNSLAGDVGEIWATLSPLLLFVSPIFYSLDMLSPWGRALVLWLNPLTPFILIFQSLISNQPVPCLIPVNYYQACAYGVFFMLIGYSFFKKFEKKIIESI